MPSVFISYSSQQLAVAQQLEAELKAKSIKVWRDKTNLHAGEQWRPKALGDAIADANALVLLWSSEASQSDFVELEWNIAVAMKKSVMPYLIDDTPLPPTLKPSHRYQGHDISQAAVAISTSMGQVPSVPTPQAQKTLLAKLESIPSAAEKTVLQEIKTFIHQPNWTVQNVYQVQGDLHVNQEEGLKPSKPPVERVGAWVALVVGLLTIVGWVIDLPEKLGWRTDHQSHEEAQSKKENDYPFEGQVLDLQGQGLNGVSISLTVPGQKPQTFETKKSGMFKFDVLTEAGKGATLQAQKTGFKPKRRNVTIPDQRYVLKMEPISEEEQP